MVFIQVAKVRSRADRKTAELAMFIHSRSSDCADTSTAGKTIAVTNTVRPSTGGANENRARRAPDGRRRHQVRRKRAANGAKWDSEEKPFPNVFPVGLSRLEARPYEGVIPKSSDKLATAAATPPT